MHSYWSLNKKYPRTISTYLVTDLTPRYIFILTSHCTAQIVRCTDMQTPMQHHLRKMRWWRPHSWQLPGECNKVPSYCGGPHRVKDKTCPFQVKEQTILDIQNKNKVGKRRARQIYEGHDALDVTKNKIAFATHFICKIDEVMKRKLTTWALEKCLHNELGAKPSNIRSGGTDNFIVHVTEESSSRLITQIKTINNIPNACLEQMRNITIIPTKNLYLFKNMSLIISINSKLVSCRNIHSVMLSEHNGLNLIAKHSTLAQPIVLTFRKDLPEYIDIPCRWAVENKGLWIPTKANDMFTVSRIRPHQEVLQEQHHHLQAVRRPGTWHGTLQQPTANMSPLLK